MDIQVIIENIEYIFNNTRLFVARIFDNIISNAIYDIIKLIIIAVCIKCIIIFLRYLKRVLRKDKYSDLYGRWYMYRLGEKGDIIDTIIDVYPSYIRKYPRAVFRSEHVEPGYYAEGHCRIFNPNVYFEFDKPRRGSYAYGPFYVWVLNQGDKLFNKIKCGAACGPRANGNIRYSDILLSRDPIEFSKLKPVLNKSRSLEHKPSCLTISKLIGDGAMTSFDEVAGSKISK